MHVLWILFYFIVGLPVLLGQINNDMPKPWPITKEFSEISTVLIDHVTQGMTRRSSRLKLAYLLCWVPSQLLHSKILNYVELKFEKSPTIKLHFR